MSNLNLKKEERTNVAAATSGILVSIFLLLFGFFAVLLSLADGRDIRAGAIMDGISATFQKLPNLKGELVDSKSLKILIQDKMVEEIRDLLNDKKFEESKQRTEFGEAIRFKIPVSSYFAENSENPQENFVDLGQRLVNYVVSAEPEQVRKVEVMMGVGEGRAAKNASAYDKFMATQRINEIANLLTNMGLEEDHMRLGVAPVKNTDIIITMLVIYGGG